MKLLTAPGLSLIVPTAQRARRAGLSARLFTLTFSGTENPAGAWELHMTATLANGHNYAYLYGPIDGVVAGKVVESRLNKDDIVEGYVPRGGKLFNTSVRATCFSKYAV